MREITATQEWHLAYPRSCIGLLEIAGVQNHLPSAGLEQRKRRIEAELRQRYQGFARQDFLSLPVISAYWRYYKRFDKTYHVLLQLESLVLKNKDLPLVSPLVDANFMAELETLVLTAGHDLEKLHGPLLMDVSSTSDQLTRMGGRPKQLPAGDMIMRDARGVACSILYGQDDNSPISPETTHALYVSYAPAEVPVDSVHQQLDRILEYVHLFSPAALPVRREVIIA